MQDFEIICAEEKIFIYVRTTSLIFTRGKTFKFQNHCRCLKSLKTHLQTGRYVCAARQSEHKSCSQKQYKDIWPLCQYWTVPSNGGSEVQLLDGRHDNELSLANSKRSLIQTIVIIISSSRSMSNGYVFTNQLKG